MTKCGCSIKGLHYNSMLEARPYIVFCPLHSAAEELLEMVKDIRVGGIRYLTPEGIRKVSDLIAKASHP